MAATVVARTRSYCAVQQILFACWMMMLSLIRSSSVRALQATQAFGVTQRRLIRRCDFTIDATTIIPSGRGLAAATAATTTSRPRHGGSGMAASSEELGMENIYQEWTISQDQLLWENRNEPVSTLASLLGRGLRGTEQRLVKLRDIESSAYQRLFAGGNVSKKMVPGDYSGESTAKPKLVPASEVLRRIQWDESLSSKDFSVLHYDRVEDTIVESPVDAPNGSISGKATRFIDALPEHRIVAIKYRERIVWDREKREDHIFSNEGIINVIKGYSEWKRNKDEEEEQNRQRRAQVAENIQQILGLDRFAVLQELSNDLASRMKSDPTMSVKLEAEKYVQSALDLFRQARKDLTLSLMPERIPKSDFEALDTLSELVAILPDSTLRPLILVEISIRIKQAESKKVELATSKHRELPEIDENDVTETFIRGTGPGGQKVNKTSNRVFLVHEPTQLRVECQDTRSLQQNRKIARKRLREKLDEYLNGNQSKANVAAQKASTKKAKAKARSRARQRQKQSANEDSEEDDSDDDSSDDSSRPY